MYTCILPWLYYNLYYDFIAAVCYLLSACPRITISAAFLRSNFSRGRDDFIIITRITIYNCVHAPDTETPACLAVLIRALRSRPIILFQFIKRGFERKTFLASVVTAQHCVRRLIYVMIIFYRQQRTPSHEFNAIAVPTLVLLYFPVSQCVFSPILYFVIIDGFGRRVRSFMNKKSD